MAHRREDIAPELRNIPIGCSWIPTTPAKPDSTKQQLICENWSENHPVQANWLEPERFTQRNWYESGRLPGHFLQGQTLSPIYLNGGGFNTWHVGDAANSNVYEDTLRNFDTWQAHEGTSSHIRGKEGVANKLSVKEADKCYNLSFANLLALQHAVGNTASMGNAVAQIDFAATSSISAPIFHPQIEGRQSKMRIGNSSVPDMDCLLGANVDAGLSSIPHTMRDGGSNISRPFLDLNSPPRTITDAASDKIISFQFEPITPEKANKVVNREEEGTVQDLSRDEVAAAKQGTDNEISRTEIKGKNEMEKRPQQLTDQLCEGTMSTQLQENHKPDKGGTEEADLSKTPPQKPRRKKHRPKVIIEGQRKSTPKTSSQKPAVPQEHSVPQETTRVKRKYVRRKGVNNATNTPSEGETNETDLNKKDLSPKDTPPGKRQYVRKNQINKTEATLDEGTTKPAELKTVRQTRSSCRRSLKFDVDDQVRDESSSHCPYSNSVMEVHLENFNAINHSRTTVQGKQDVEMVETSRTGIASEVHSTNQVLEGYLSSPHTEINRLHGGYRLTDKSVSTRGKCQIVFSDVTHDKETNAVQITKNSDGQWTTNGSICSSTCLRPEEQARGLKRQHKGTAAQAEISNTNASGTVYNCMQAYCSVVSQNADKNIYNAGMHFPVICKKKRTEKAFSTTSSLQYSMITSNDQGNYERRTFKDSGTKMTSITKQESSIAQSTAASSRTNNPASEVTHNAQQVFDHLLALGPRERIKKRRSKGSSRLRDLASLVEICKQLPASPSSAATTSRFEQKIEIEHEAPTCMEPLTVDTRSRPTCMETLAADIRSTMMTKKRSKRSILVNSVVQNWYNHYGSATTSIALDAGPPLAITWKCISPIDSITEQLNQLDLNAESSQISARKHNAFTAYNGHYQENALVPYQRNGAVIPFDNSFDQVRRRKPRPKVDLDDETTRVWRLLLENINNEGIDGTDEEKTKWWEEERRVFRGRADSFIARMHLVQGDRRFSPWKGSVVDSVVGVFLTQNVSDHLSSSAFMSLAARFPLRTETTRGDLYEERAGIKIDEPEACTRDNDETFTSCKTVVIEPICDEESKMLQDLGDDKIRVANSVKSSGNNWGDIITDDSLRGQDTNVSKHGPVMSHESTANKSRSSTEDGRDVDDVISSQTSVISSQSSADSPMPQTERTESCRLSNSEEEPASGNKSNSFDSSTSFVKLLQMAGTVLHGVYGKGTHEKVFGNAQIQSESSAANSQKDYHSKEPSSSEKYVSCSKSTLSLAPNLEEQAGECFDSVKNYGKSSDNSSKKGLCAAEISGLSEESASQSTFQKFPAVSFEERPMSLSPNANSSYNNQIEINPVTLENQKIQVPPQRQFQENDCKMQCIPDMAISAQNAMDVTGSSSNINNSNKSEHKEVESNKSDPDYHSGKTTNVPKARGRIGKNKINQVNWDSLRIEAEAGGKRREKTANTMDSVDWDAVRCSDVNEIAQTIKERGMNNMLAERIKDFLNRLVREHGSIDLEWLRDVPPDKAKEYLLSIRGLGLKSVECVRLLTLHHLAFPVDTNVGRIAVRLGWVPLQPLPESLQLHLLELYPVLESIQKYLWPRLCKLDQRTLYELHYQMITFGKVFCTKSKPNCNACPMRGECRHFASAFASARLALPAPEDKSIVSARGNNAAVQNPTRSMNTLHLPSSQANQIDATIIGVSYTQPIIEEPATPEPTIEMPDTPEPGDTQVQQCDIENAFYEDPDEIPTIKLNMEEFTQNLQKVMQQNTELKEGDMSKALVALTPEAASIPVPKLKNVSRLRTEHQVYELPDSHPLLEGMDKREPDDPCPYLLAIWTPGETVNSIEPPERRCHHEEPGKLCTDETCLACNSIREVNSQTVRGTLLIPCRTAMRGSFPLNGTYFQVNEVFSDHESSLTPMDVPREWLWNLPRRTVYFGTSIPTIFKGLTTEGIQYCFWRGFVCVRGFDRTTRAPRPLIARLHFPASKLGKGKGKTD